MKILRLYFLIFIMISKLSFANDNKTNKFEANISEIPADMKNKMKQFTWHEGCPVLLKDLRYLNLSFFGFDNKVHIGEIIVHKLIAKEVTEIFKELYYNKFQIEKMELMDSFHGDDLAAMKENNTSAFNCRTMTGKKNIFSLHSYGIAIDINTKINPYVYKNMILPENGKSFVDRSLKAPGIIILNDSTYKAFIKRGWKWGGEWKKSQDYQHFEKSELKKIIKK
ncbi:M15 family metallopeptidase [Silvanigrella aquatica]|uniref:Peptidase M15C domain-containing protein n=1 Tax=Silvanigrella aquatica TaxID=1915309 RepID=A0A1L4D0G5_9BACT|nr:M15 family metallopeptidase [Silvanigrella aquatica]APJ03684.1 hypothetical protein AXG55_07105 [Silvanigrella aquatica]